MGLEVIVPREKEGFPALDQRWSSMWMGLTYSPDNHVGYPVTPSNVQ